jgi:DNA-binding NarL/FixJ family response regulator
VGILFLTNIIEPRLTERGSTVLPAGASYLLKSNIVDINVLLDAIDSVVKGHKASIPRDDKNSSHALSKLSGAQLDVIRLLAAGKSNEEIAVIRGTTTRAVRLLVARAMNAIGIDESGGPEKRVRAALEFLKVTGLRK